jgi:uroporphyrinogen-III synthase
MRPLVILRPQPGAAATAKAARDMGLVPLVTPLFRIEPLEWTAPPAADFEALLVTSANAIRYGGGGVARYRELPAHCVGEASAAEARTAGFAVAGIGSAGVERLLLSLPPDLRLLHLCGADRHVAGGAAQAITAIETYRAVELPAPDGFETIEGAVVALHSPRAARRFARLVDEATVRRDSIALAAISEEAAAAASGGWEAVEAAPRPTDSALLAIASRLCNKPA